MRPYSILCQRPLLSALIVIALPLALGFFGAFHPAFDSFSHFRAHLAVVLALVALPLLFSKTRIEAIVALIFAAAAFATTAGALPLPGLSPVQAGFKADAGERAVYRLLQMNLRYDNPTPEKVLSLIGRTQPDIIALNEVSAMWEAKLAFIASAYPHRIICSHPYTRSGVAILSRRPFAGSGEPRCDDRGAFAIASVNFGGQPVDVATIHMGWPWPFFQQWQVGAMTPSLRSLGPTALMAGDCNAVPWSATVRRIAEAGGLDTMPSIGATWQLAGLPDFLRFAGLPIDHVFSKGAVLVHSARLLEPVGSDHLPTMVEFSLRPEPGQPGDDEDATAFAAAEPAFHPTR